MAAVVDGAVQTVRFKTCCEHEPASSRDCDDMLWSFTPITGRHKSHGLVASTPRVPVIVLLQPTNVHEIAVCACRPAADGLWRMPHML